MDNRFIVDWLSFTTKIDSLDSIIKALGLSHITFLPVGGFYGYQEALLFDGIRIHFNGRDDMGILVEMSGKGCRLFETYNTIGGFNAVFDLILDNEYNCSRIDVAYDDFKDIFPLVEFKKDVEQRNHISRFTTFKITQSLSDKFDGLNVELGSKKSEIMFRFYDKKAEQQSKGNVVESATWVRAEMQLRGDRALKFISLYNGENLGDLFCGVLLNYYRVIIPGTNAVKSRCQVADYWKTLINNAVKVKLFTPVGSEYTILNLENFVLKQAGGAIDTYSKIVGVDGMMKKLEDMTRAENKNYVRILHEHKQQAELSRKNKEINDTVVKPLQAVKKVRVAMPQFILSEQVIEQMKFDIDPLTVDLNSYKPYKYHEN